METRPLGETGHESSVVAFGTFALQFRSQKDADELVETALDHGVNHFDVAPTYGDAEEKLAPKLDEYREDVFLACKTLERGYDGAREELEASLDRLGVDSIDLYQFHAVTTEDGLDRICGEGEGENGGEDEGTAEDDDGALAAVLDAREAGLVDNVGLTSHGHPRIVREAIERIDDLDTVMFPLNVTLLGKDGPEYDYGSVLELARERGLGTIAIKAFAKGPWPDDLPEDDRPYGTWYEPYDSQDEIEDCLRFALSQGLTTITSPGDPRLVPDVLSAAEGFEPMSEAEQERLLEAGRDRESPVPTG